MVDAKTGHVVLCGLDGLGLRTFEELRKLGEDVVVIAPTASDGFAGHARAQGATIVEGSYREEAMLRAAGVDRARALVIVESNDVGNIHAALAAQEINPELRIVLRIFNQDFGGRLQTLFRDCVVLSSSAIAAPAFVTAALLQTWEQEIQLAGKTMSVREASAHGEGVLLPLGRICPDAPVELFPADGDKLVCLVEGPPGGASPEAKKSAARRNRLGALDYARAVIRNSDSRLRYALLFLLALVIVSTVIFFSFNTDLSEALYNSVTVIISGGLGDLNPQAVPLPLKLFGIALMLIGATVITVFYALITDAIVSVRLERALGRQQVHMSDHVVVCGLGNIGYRVVTQLHAIGVPVAATEKMEEVQGIPEVRRLGVPVLVADARAPETLRALNVGKAKSVVVATDDDAANLETALNARAINPGIRVVLRLFDPDLASRVERAFNIHISRSVSALAAPSFAAAAVGHKVVATIPVGDRVLIVAEETIETGSWAEGRSVGELEGVFEGRVLLVERAGEAQIWCPPPDYSLASGDEIALIAPRKGLVEAVRMTSTEYRVPSTE
jgi:Trk K+ transport system NAD-binding subunit